MFVRSLRSRAVIALIVGAAITVVMAGGERVLANDLERIESEIADAREERSGVQDRIDQATRTYEELVARIATLDTEREDLAADVEALRGDLYELDELVTDRLRAVFKHGSGVDPLTVFLASEDPQAALTRAETVQRAVAADRARTEDLAAARARLAAAEERLEDQQGTLDVARDEQAAARDELQASYAALGSQVTELEEELQAEQARLERERLEREREERLERERQEAAASSSSGSSTSGSASGSTTSAPASTSGSGMACPLDHPRSFIDSWGHARSGGRAHRGTDLMGPRGIPVRAITSGVWSIQRPGPSAGLWAILRADNGDHFWYLHLDSHTVANGARVSAGQQVGTNGSTGNAVAGAEHVHFEHHPGGGRAINPYPLLRRVCG